MPTTRRGAGDPRESVAQTEYFAGNEIVGRVINAYKKGHEDAVNQTVDLSRTDAGRRAIEAMAQGDAKAYSTALARQRGKVV